MRALNRQSSSNDIAWLLEYMANPGSLSILICLADSSRTMSEIAGQSGLRTDEVSLNLRTLVEDGLVIRDRAAKQITYSCSSPAVPTVIAALEACFR